MTRFNLATPGREASFRTRPDWLAKRFELFERYCLSGMAAQTEQDFDWIIYFDDGTPPEFRARISELQKRRSFIAFYTPLFPANGWRDSVFASVSKRTPFLLTTNLDNDDSLAIDYVARLHEVAARHAGESRLGINFLHGYVLNGSRLYAHEHSSNAFTNLLERFDDSARTAPSIMHMELAKHAPVHQIEGAGAWLQVIHGGNVSNKIRGRRVSRSLADERFAPQAITAVTDPGLIELTTDRLVYAPVRRARDAAIAAVRALRARR